MELAEFKETHCTRYSPDRETDEEKESRDRNTIITPQTGSYIVQYNKLGILQLTVRRIG